jgi:hypothetical protein
MALDRNEWQALVKRKIILQVVKEFWDILE